MSNKTSDNNVVTNKDLEVLEARIFFYENSKKIGIVDKMIPRAVKENEAIKHLLAEREQKNKRIKELEEEIEKANRQIDLDYVDENYIPKRSIVDKIEELKLANGSDGKDNVENLVRELLTIDILQELLGVWGGDESDGD